MSDAETRRARAEHYVLGLLDAHDEAQILAESRTDADLRAELAASRDRFVELDLAVRPVPVPETLWGRIASRLDEPGEAEEAPAAPRREAANDNLVERWRRLAIGAFAAAMVFAVGLGWSLTNQPEPKIIAVLMNAGGEPLALIEDFGDTQARVVLLADIEVPAGRTMQVWTKPSEEIGPVSLGLLAAPGTEVLAGPRLPQPRKDQLYEITFEPAGGSPTGLPTGPIVAKGFASAPL